MLHSMTVRLIHVDQLEPFYHLCCGVKCQSGVIWGREAGRVHQLDTLYKSHGSRNSPGAFGVTRVKRSFSPKMLFPLQIKWYDHGTHVYSSARYPLQKLWV